MNDLLSINICYIYIYYNVILILVHVGLEKQTSRIPLRFFWELLSDKKRLVLTGIRQIDVKLISYI